MSELPQLGAEQLHETIGEYSERRGPGGAHLDEAKPYWNARDYDRAAPLLENAIEAELTMPYESLAHSLLGQISIERGDLANAVQDFVRCLETPVRAADALWQSAARLHLIYHEAGRIEEANALYRLAEEASRRGPGWALTADHVEQIRRLVREQRVS